MERDRMPEAGNTGGNTLMWIVAIALFVAVIGYMVDGILMLMR